MTTTTAPSSRAGSPRAVPAVHIPVRGAALIRAATAITDATLIAGQLHPDLANRGGEWERAAKLAATPSAVGQLPPLFTGQRLRSGPAATAAAMQIPAGLRDDWIRRVYDQLGRTDLSDDEWLLAAETYIALAVLIDRETANPLDVWLRADDARILDDAVREIFREPAEEEEETSSEAVSGVATPVAPTPAPPPPLAPVPAPAPAPAPSRPRRAGRPGVVPVPAPSVPAPVLAVRPVGPGPIGGIPGAVLAPAASPFVALLRNTARRDGRAGDAYEWPNTRLLGESVLLGLWMRIESLRDWFGPETDSSVRDAEIVTVFGPPPYFFLKPWAVDPDRQLILPPPSATRKRRAPHRFVDPAYRAMRPGPNYYHHGGGLRDDFGRLYSVGTETTSDAPVLYYKRPTNLECGHPGLGDRLTLRHVYATRECPGACPGHHIEVEATRILPRAATGVVVPLRLPPEIARELP